MKCRYEPVKQRVHTDELDDYETYGIRVTTESGEEIAAVSDVSLDGTRVDELCRQFNECELSPLHLLDAIDKSM